MSVLCVIPARYGSKRFPGKALAFQTGKPLIRHVYEAAARAKRVDAVVVATDDERIRAAAPARCDWKEGSEKIFPSRAGGIL
jgi:3-deoxy-manno-octulosonate cytidylyltransferase (CMP-KDO synthetase)